MRNDKKPFNRRCASCGRISGKESFIRIVRERRGNCFFDRTGCADGRGSYICRASECIAKAEKKGSLERSFKAKIDPEQKRKLFEEIKEFAKG